ncbi:MAG: transposase, partial [Rikenellaceae bacterium]
SGSILRFNSEKYRSKSAIKNMAIIVLHYLMLPRISRYCSDSRYEIDNNSIERAVRPVTLGRKNYLFSGCSKGAEDNALFYTFISTCKELDIEPIEWFNFALSNITDKTTEEELKKFLLKNFKK